VSGGPTDYLTVAEILAIHDDLIERYGGAAGVRDPGQLEAALFRPQTGYYVDVIAQAAALWESLSQNHAFVDGNKRVAFAAMFAFLTINGVSLMATADEACAGDMATPELPMNALNSPLETIVRPRRQLALSCDFRAGVLHYRGGRAFRRRRRTL
jgi:death-on-curing protein